MRYPQQKSAGFTRLELAAVIGGLCLLALVALPAFATSLSDAHRSVCANNLRQLGSGLLGWAGDHREAVPWRVSVSSGGSFYPGKAGNAWFEFLVLSNHVSPRVITCPADMTSDPSIRSSADWGAFRTNRHSSVSYQIYLDVGTGRQEEAEVVLADRNTRYDGISSCSSGIANANGVRLIAGTSAFAWTNAVHGLRGHALMMDGSVEFTSTPRLVELVGVQNLVGGGECHFMKAR